MFDTKPFKQAVLNQAMRGKLTQQLPEDGNASELLKSIDNEKQRLIKEGKIKKQKALPDIAPDEISFQIPDNWQWVRFSYLYDMVGGSQPPKSEFINESKNGYIRLYQTRDYGIHPSPVFIPIDKARKITNDGDILVARYGGSLGKIFRAKYGAYNVAMAKVTPKFTNNEVDNNYLWYYLQSEFYNNFINSLSKSAQAGFNKNDLTKLIFPLPPLKEQQRIASQIDKCFKLADSIDDEHELNRNFSTNMHTSLLNAAMQGKLTKQLPEDGNASDLLNSIKDEKQRLIDEGKIKKQKPLPDIDPDDVPFEIPDNWQWVRIPEVSTFPEQKTVKSSDISGDTWVLDLKDIEKNTGKINHKNYNKDSKVKSNKVIFNKGDVLYNKLRPYLNKVIVAPDSGVATSELFVITPFDGINANYLSLVLRSPFFLSKINSDTYGTKMPRAGTKNFIKYLIPLPPFLEQQRIVSKLNSLFSKLNRI